MNTNTDGTFTINTGVIAGNHYSLTIKAQNAAGTSVASTSYPVLTIPGQPAVSNIVPGTTSIAFSYARNVSDASNSVATYLYSLDGSTYIDMSSNTDGTFTINSGVIAGNSYNLSIKAQNTAGTSVASNSSSVVTYPSPPILNSVTRGYNSIRFTYTAPTNGNVSIDRYAYSLSGDTNYIDISYNGQYLTDGSYTITNNIVAGTLYKIRIKSRNATGYSQTYAMDNTGVIPYTTPGVPTINVIEGSFNNIRFTYSPPISNGYDTITKYAYSIDASNYYDIGTDGSYTIYNSANITLIPATRYYVRLKAYNAAGYSQPFVDTVGAVPYTIPNAPTINNVVAGNQTLTVTFTPSPVDVGTPITYYRFSLNNGVTFPYTSTTSPFTITGLTNGTAYTVKMDAYDIAGDSIDSNSFGPITPYTYPSAPTITNVTQDASKIYVYFNTPNNNGSAILGYKYSTNGTYQTVAGLTSPILITNLTNGIAVNITLKAYNLAGDSAASNASASITPYTIPDPPTITRIQPITGSIQVYFTPPNFNGGNTITGYKYSLDGGAYQTISTASPFTIGGIANGAIVSVVLKATNAAGDSYVSNTFTTATNSVPYPPTITSVTAGINKITFTFDAPGFDGGQPITNYVYSIDASHYVYMNTTTAGTYIIEDGAYDISSNYYVNMIPGNAYTVILKAENSIGRSTGSTSNAVIPYDVTDPPTINGISTTDSILFLYFTPPVNTNGSNIISYKYSLNDGPYTTIDTSSSPIIIGNILPDQSYYVYLKTTNAAGDSAPSNPSNTIVAASLVKPSANVTVDAAERTSQYTAVGIANDIISNLTSSSTNTNTNTSGATKNPYAPVGAVSSSNYLALKKYFSTR